MSTNEKPLVIGWKVSALNVSVASVRYRALFPMLALREQGVSSKVFASGSARNLAGIDVLVIVKSFTPEDVALAQSAVDMGIPVLYDLCDNVFAEGYGRNGISSPSDILRQIGTIVTAFVVTTEALADAIRDQVRSDISIYVVPDGIETTQLTEAAAAEIARACEAERNRPWTDRIRYSRRGRKLMELLRTGSLRGIPVRVARYLLSRTAKRVYATLEPIRAGLLGRPSRIKSTAGSRHQGTVKPVAEGTDRTSVIPSPLHASPNAKRLLWYGNHGADYGRFGMVDLVDIRDSLERIAREFDVELVVISNHAEKFQRLILPIAIPSRYVEWSPARVQEELARADIVLVPNSCDEFSVCKSANRTALALVAGLPVVATATPALIPLDDCIEAGDFYTGIRRYLQHPELAASHVAIAQARCEQLYGQQAIANTWNNVLANTAASADAQANKASKPELILVANLVQDVEFIRPLVKTAHDSNIEVAIWASTSMIKRWPYTLRAMSELGACLRVMPDAGGRGTIRFPESVRAVLTVADTNLGPHRFSNDITRAANRAGIVTGTLQHGFENVGLTYSDDLHAVERVEFAAKQIFVWGEPSLLHPRVRRDTQNKCVAVGCPKPVSLEQAVLPPAVPAGKPIVGIFENLHWHRYDDAYRAFFLEGVADLATRYPDVTFIVKPHNAGRWLTTRFDGEPVTAPNLLIADPSDPEWEGLTAAAMLPHLSGVITSPSTVALDAARAGLPVAVVAHAMALENYAPLHLITGSEQWSGFVERLLDATGRQALVDTSHAFVARVLIPGDAAARIVRHLLNPITDAQGIAA